MKRSRATRPKFALFAFAGGIGVHARRSSGPEGLKKRLPFWTSFESPEKRPKRLSKKQNLVNNAIFVPTSLGSPFKVRNYLKFKWANVWIHVTQDQFPFDYDDFFSTIVTGKKKRNTDLEEINAFIRQHTSPSAKWTINNVEFQDVWWKLDKHLFRKLIVDSIQLHYIYDLRLYLEEGDAKWEGLRHKSPRKKGAGN